MQKKSKKSLIYVIIACACVTCAGIFAFPFSPFYLREKVIPVLDGDGMEQEGTWLINLEVNSKQAGDFISPGDMNFYNLLLGGISLG